LCPWLHIKRRYRTPHTPPWIWSDNHDEISPCTRLSKDGPSGFFDVATSASHDPRRITVFIDNFFNFFEMYTVPCDMLDIVLIPFRIEFLKPHADKIPQGGLGRKFFSKAVR
jgi:hypothetical protein